MTRVNKGKCLLLGRPSDLSGFRRPVKFVPLWFSNRKTQSLQTLYIQANQGRQSEVSYLTMIMTSTFKNFD